MRDRNAGPFEYRAVGEDSALAPAAFRTVPGIATKRRAVYFLHGGGDAVVQIVQIAFYGKRIHDLTSQVFFFAELFFELALALAFALATAADCTTACSGAFLLTAVLDALAASFRPSRVGCERFFAG